MRSRLSRPLAGFAVAVLVLTACGSSDGDDDAAASTTIPETTTTTVPDCSVTEAEALDAPGAPESIEVDDEVVVEKVTEADRDNCPIDAFGFNTIQIIGANESGDTFVDTWDEGRPLSLQSGMLLPALDEAMADMVVGDLRTIAIPAALAYGSEGDPSIGVGVDEPVFFTVRLEAVTPQLAACRNPAPLANAGVDGKPEAVDLPVEPPTEVVVEDLEPGDGVEAKDGDAVSIHYVGVSCTYGTEFDSSYERGEPLDVPAIGTGLIEGFSEGLIGVKPGMVRIIQIPADLAYGEAAPSPDIAPSDPLVFHVSIESVTPAGTDDTGDDTVEDGEG